MRQCCRQRRAQQQQQHWLAVVARRGSLQAVVQVQLQAMAKAVLKSSVLAWMVVP